MTVKIASKSNSRRDKVYHTTNCYYVRSIETIEVEKKRLEGYTECEVCSGERYKNKPTFEEKECWRCGERYKILAKHLRGCDG